MRDQRLDALRSIAALLVFASHIGGALDARFLDAMLHRFNVGHVGVVAFFLISGHIIPQSLRHGGRVFVIRRFLRLYPLYWLNCLLLGGAPLVLLANLTMTPSLFGIPALNGGAWTLAVELAFYGSILLCRRVPAAFVCVALAAASLALPWLWYLALCWAGTQRRPVLPLLVLCCTFTPYFLAYESAHILPRVCGMTIFYLWRWQPRALVWIGERSYSLYLMHGLAIAHLPPLLWMPGAIIAAALSYRLVEQPAIALGRRLTQPSRMPRSCKSLPRP